MAERLNAFDGRFDPQSQSAPVLFPVANC